MTSQYGFGGEFSYGNDAEVDIDAMILDEPKSWGATPLGLTTDEHVIAAQRSDFYDRELRERAAQYFDADTPVEIARLCDETIDGVNHRRGIENHGSYMHRQLGEHTTDFITLEQAAMEGRANALGLFVLGHILDMPSIELAKTTFQGDLWPNAREEVANAMYVRNSDAVWVRDSLDKMPRFGRAARRIISYTPEGLPAERSDELLGFTVRARKYRGQVDERTHVREVISALIRIDEASGFDQDIARTLQEVYDPHLAPHDTIGSSPATTEFRNMLHTAIEMDDEPFEKWAIPITSTIYAYDPTWGTRHGDKPAEEEYSAPSDSLIRHLAEQKKRYDLEKARPKTPWPGKHDPEEWLDGVRPLFAHRENTIE